MAERSLHIGIDARELAGKPTGVGRYVAEILRVWRSDPNWPHRVTLFGGDGPVAVLPALPVLPDVPALPALPALPDVPAGTWWEQVHLPRLVRQAGVDVLFAPAYTAPLIAPCPVVLAVHDLSFFAHPEWFHPRERLRRRWVTRAAARRAARVLTLSEFSATEIERFLGIERARIVLAPPAAVSIPVPDAPVLDVGLGRPPLVLYVGSLFNRRRIPLLIEAFARVARTHPAARLVLLGDNRTSPRIDPAAIARTHGVDSQVEWREYASEESLSRYYHSARVFAYLSEYEGFGIPPMEALAQGVPSVLLNTPVAREIYGPAASLSAPTADEVAAALAALLSDRLLRETRLRHGRRLLQRFTWQRTAAIVRRTLEEVTP